MASQDRSAAYAGQCEGLRQWVVIARLGGEISAKSAAARLSAIDKAEQRGEEPPDVREWSNDGD